MATEVEINCGGCGCLIFFFILFWVLLFGLTVGGSHYEVGCNTSEGVALRTEHED